MSSKLKDLKIFDLYDQVFQNKLNHFYDLNNEIHNLNVKLELLTKEYIELEEAYESVIHFTKNTKR